MKKLSICLKITLSEDDGTNLIRDLQVQKNKIYGAVLDCPNVNVEKLEIAFEETYEIGQDGDCRYKT